jgi:hypothetical protein
VSPPAGWARCIRPHRPDRSRWDARAGR